MSNAPQKTSEELAREMQKLMPKLKDYCGWQAIGNFYALGTTQGLYKLAELVFAQQEEIEQLKAELAELKQR